MGQSPNGIGGDPFELGVLLLSEPVTDRSPATLPALGLLDDLKKEKMLHSGDQFTVVGYGAVGLVDNAPFVDGQRRSAYTRYSSLNGEAVTFSTARNAPSACFGDSGGPNFLEVGGDVVLTSVTWWLGNLRCTSWHRAYRLDTPQAQSFLGNFIVLPASG